MSIRKNYNHTIYASYIGYITQAIVNNLTPLLFLTFARTFSLELGQITLLTTVNFAVQLAVDLLSTRLVDRIGYRVSVVAAHVFAVLGLMGLGLLPRILPDPYQGLLLSAVLYAIGGGLIEVLISPIVEACPTEKKEAAMSLLHSFYCWGHVAVILLSTAFFRIFGLERWPVLAMLWAIVPAVNILYFTQVPLYSVTHGAQPISVSGLLRSKIFWVLMAVMVCAGASEQALSQWASAFAEAGLGISKTAGDLAGPCTFALFMGISRALYGSFSDRLPLKKAMLGSACLCVVAYLLAALAADPILALAGCGLCGFSVGIFWPGTFSVAAWNLPAGGTALYALMALAGDLGCSGGPTLVGFAAEAFGGRLNAGLLTALVFPVVILFGIPALKDGKQTGN